MRTNFIRTVFFVALILIGLSSRAEEETRNIAAFSEISLRVPAKLYLEQGEKQRLEIVAKPSTLQKVITEVRDRKLVIRFPNKDYLWSDFQPGEITIYITVPQVDALSVSGSGDIIAESEIKTRIIDLTVSGSGDIRLSELNTERLKAAISGSGDVVVGSKVAAQDASVAISGSGNFKGIEFKSNDVSVKIAGSGNASIEAVKNLNVRIAGSGNVFYRGNPLIDQSVAGSGTVKKEK